MGKPRYAEDYEVGTLLELGSYVFTADEIIAFSKVWDPHVFHIDEENARKTMFGGLIASGWHVALVMMRMMHEGGFLSLETSVGSPGHEEVRWLAPVRPGDRLVGQVEITGVKVSETRPELGFVRHYAWFNNQDRQRVYLLNSTAMILTRKASGGSQRSGSS